MQSFQPDRFPDALAILEGQIRECYGRVVYSHKTHEKCADLLLSRLTRLRLTQIILSALTTAGFLGAFFAEGSKMASFFGMVISTILLCINSYTKDYDLGQLAQRHKDAANILWYLRESFQSLLVDIATREKDLIELQSRRDRLIDDLRDAYKNAPSTSSLAYKKAQEALKFNEDLTFNDAEIDAFLPKELRRSDRI